MRQTMLVHNLSHIGFFLSSGPHTLLFFAKMTGLTFHLSVMATFSAGLETNGERRRMILPLLLREQLH